MVRKTKQQKNFDKRIGQVLCRHRKTKKVPVEHVAEKVGISLVAYQKYETGKMTIGLATLIEITNAIGVSIHDIIGEATGREIKKRTAQQERLAVLLERLPEKAIRKFETLASDAAEGKG